MGAPFIPPSAPVMDVTGFTITPTGRQVASKLADVVVGPGAVYYLSAYYQATDGKDITQAIARVLASNSAANVEIHLPAGNWTAPSVVAPGFVTVTYVLDPGATVNLPGNLGGIVSRPGRQQKMTFGTYDNAAVRSVIANYVNDQQPGVNGFPPNNPSIIATYASRDSVALFVGIYGPPIALALAGSSYTATTLIPATPMTAAQMAVLRIGMIIDTGHSPKYSGIVTGWAPDGSSISVATWYQMGNTSSGQVPSGTATGYVNPITKIFGENLVATLDANSYGNAASGREVDIVNNKAEYNPSDSTTPVMWAYDAANLGTYRGAAAYIARYNFYNHFESQGAFNSAFQVDANAAQDPQYGFLSKQITGVPFAFNPNATGFRFVVDNNGYATFGNTTAANGIKVSGAASGSFPSIVASGVDGNFGLTVGQGGSTTGSGNVFLAARTGPGNEAFRAFVTASQVNGARVTGGAAGAPPTWTVGGSDANIDFYVLPIGTGKFKIGTASAAATTPSSFSAARSIAIKDITGTTYYIPLSASPW